MIYTFTLNPALDRTIWVEKFQFGETMRTIREERYPGGKGIDVSRMIKTLGGDSVALGFLGGYTGLEIEGRLLNEGIPHDFIRIAGETRTNIIVHSIETDEELKINAPGPDIEPIELGLLLEKIRNLRPFPTYAVISGSLPRGLAPDIYAQICLTLEGMGANVIIDASGEALAKGISATPFMIKPNIREFEEYAGKKLEGMDAVIATAKKIVLEGKTEVVVVSAGRDGAIAVTANEAYRAFTPDVRIVNSVGAGDSLVAGIVFGLDKGLKIADALQLGTACGTATAMSDGTAKGTKKMIESVLPDIRIERV